MDIPSPKLAVALLSVVCLVATGACGPAVATSSPRPVDPTPTARATGDVAPGSGSLVIVGPIITLDDPPIAEALLIEDGIVLAVGTRVDVLALAGKQVPVVDIGRNVAYPGFIDAHAHWIGDRDIYEADTPAAAMDAALARGWTSISEQWVDQGRIDELEALAADGALPLRVDAYLALNYGMDFLGDWYVGRDPGAVDDHLRVQGLKIHLDTGSGAEINWEPADVTAAIGRAHDAGWQVSVHAMSSAAIESLLDAYEATLGPTGPNALHHRIEHALQVTDEHLARLVAMDIATVIHLDGAADWLTYDAVLPLVDRADPEADVGSLTRWRDFVEAGLRVASATDAPWTFPDFEPGDRRVDLTDDVGRPVDQIAAGMDGRLRLRPAPPSWSLDQLLTAEQGLRAVTIDAAWALGDEANRGHLAPGTLGDVTILSGDVTDATPDDIRAMTVIATIVGGIAVHCPDAAVCAPFE